jgi:hypothetical protein
MDGKVRDASDSYLAESLQKRAAPAIQCFGTDTHCSVDLGVMYSYCQSGICCEPEVSLLELAMRPLKVRSSSDNGRRRGVILGRKPKLTSHQKRDAIGRREAGEVLTEIARSYNVSHSTISRLR